MFSSVDQTYLIHPQSWVLKIRHHTTIKCHSRISVMSSLGTRQAGGGWMKRSAPLQSEGRTQLHTPRVHPLSSSPSQNPLEEKVREGGPLAFSSNEFWGGDESIQLRSSLCLTLKRYQTMFEPDPVSFILNISGDLFHPSRPSFLEVITDVILRKLRLSILVWFCMVFHG